MAVVAGTQRTVRSCSIAQQRALAPSRHLATSPRASLGAAGPPPDQSRERRLATPAALSISVGGDVQQQVLTSLAAPAQEPEPQIIDASSPGARLLRWVMYSANIGVLAAVAAAATAPAPAPTTDPDLLASVLTSLHAAAGTYSGLLATHPVALKGLISGVVYSMGDVTAQAYEGRAGGQVDWGRTVRSAAIGAFAHGPLSHFVFSSNGSLIDTAVSQAPMLEEWQWPLAKIALDQTAYSLLWNMLYFGLLGVLRRDEPRAILADVPTGFSLMKAGWRLWPAVHVVTYAVVAPEHRLLFVDMVELAWVTVLLYWCQQSAADDVEMPTAADLAMASSQPQLETASSGTASEMRILMMDTIDLQPEDSERDDQKDAAAWAPDVSALQRTS